MREIRDDADLQQLYATGRGLIYNDFSGHGAGGKDYNVLHAARCQWVTKSNTKVRKYFFASLEEAFAWLSQNRGREGLSWKRCGSCHAEAQPAAGQMSEKPAESRSEPQGSGGIFVEREAEAILVKHLRDNGYKVAQQVRVHSGFIDIEATGRDGRWVIEVKGEDKGGYTSAEMNFQIGVGQMVARMTNPEACYALAIPWTPDFVKVLKKYKGSIGFERLGLWLFVIRRDGQVTRHDPKGVSSLLGES